MNLKQTIDIYGGGPGSGCNPEVGKCGRPLGSGKGGSNYLMESFDVLKTKGNWTHTVNGVKLNITLTAHQWAVKANGVHVTSFTKRAEAAIFVQNNVEDLTSGKTEKTVEKEKPKQLPVEKLTPTAQKTILAKAAEVKAAFMCTEPSATLQTFLDDAAKVMAFAGVDSRILTGLKSLEFGNPGIGALGVYKQPVMNKGGNKTISILKSSPSVRTIIHEFGHHVDYEHATQWSKYGPAHNTSNASGVVLKDVDTTSMHADKTAMNAEFDAVKAQAKAKYFPNEKFDWQKLSYKVKTGFDHKELKAVSAYSLLNNREWFAENFANYFLTSGPGLGVAAREKFKSDNPATFKFMDNLAQGRYFKK